MTTTADVIEAAGAVVLSVIDGRHHVLVVHRPLRSDWSLPKGKLEANEPHDVAAVREVLEETGVLCALGPFLGSRSYQVEGRAKRVLYWRATVVEHHEHTADAEVDDVQWIPADEAADRLTYPDDRELVALALTYPDTDALIVLRHAEAMKRVAWQESGDPRADDDSVRPLTARGLEQAIHLIDGLRAYGPQKVVTSDARRCQQTVTPVADTLALPLLLEQRFSERGCINDPDSTKAATDHWWSAAGPAIWCTHRPVLPILVGQLERIIGTISAAVPDDVTIGYQREALKDKLDPRLKPGDALIIHRDSERRVIAIERRNLPY